MQGKVKKDHSYFVTARFLQAVDHLVSDRSEGKRTQQRIGEELGISSSNINRLRYDDGRRVTLEACCRLCDQYKVSSFWLLLGKGSMFNDDGLSAQGNFFIEKVKELKSVTAELESALKTSTKAKKKSQQKG